MRLKGHKLTVHWNGEYGSESSSTGVCMCGWEESGSSRSVVHVEYRWHLRRERERRAIPEGGNHMNETWNVGDVFTRDGDLAEHKVLATCEDGLRVLVRRQSWGLARSFLYFMDARVTSGQERVAV